MAKLTQTQESHKQTALKALETLLNDFPTNRTTPEEVKKARAFLAAASQVGDTSSETYRKQKAVVDSYKPSGSSQTRVQIVDSIRYVKRIGFEDGQTIAASEGK